MAEGVSRSISVSLKDAQWKYRGEGNGNMVIALEKTGHVLRLVKITAGPTPKRSPLVSSDDARLNSETALLHEDTSQLYKLVAFVRDTVAPLVGRMFARHGDIVCVSGEDLRYLNAELRSLRPEFRSHKVLPECDCFALLMPDCCSRSILQEVVHKAEIQGPILTVEIKPKMGFLRESTMQRIDGQLQMTNGVCKYHLMQPWKLKTGKISAISDYCPLDLFSGCRYRGLKALKHLLRNPQNNLQIFLDGRLVFGEKITCSAAQALQEFFPDFSLEGLPDRICQLLLEALLREHNLDDVRIDLLPRIRHNARRCGYQKVFFDRREDGDSRCDTGDLCKECCCCLPIGCILERLLTLQELSDLDASALTPLYLQIKDRLDATPLEKLQEMLYGPYEQPVSPLTPGTYEYVVNKVRNYLLSCTANDCSIMVTLGRLDSYEVLPENNPWILRDINSEVDAYVHSIVLVDTDWKPHARIPSHAQQELEHIRHFLVMKAKH